MKLGLILLSIFLIQSDIDINCLNCSDKNSFSVLVISETKGWVHDSIESGLKLIPVSYTHLTLTTTPYV